ncbi:MAG: oxygen-independent coproporphyrinogen III oxidase [Zymomonas mobilis subsp. pomaceae]|uniref:Coproporphyrinogen-III oxidase n=1 Tax=Zymomonas mobilis subsp. pomaceae (strain ATCC 29192 / DSM 22645 / JCM 10191 / CCUG 17912 / NBRC 13757 / NCIMB 11200 / NRRL B-4491 / Barker I) TaxID=579138 RepID=F8ERX2_ZYMMT|nr:oxygen-independent coproporphyrinogen III oxidase [Zymomonas mobilis]AEI38585.1 oxygen-independent coproporphyrinogen III oxidase [Zymomonas mobilis subsp. pomaceae ATCC 29192]MDX5948275.1 oxygen-independent coproporphyrinogen III oxidase [Zymomonas mobilis subsp. pomaceae]GEB89030.1 oxygen-independent coproporphyrinogen III oxidase [Zymomonas mobilis subsp. pomaceae]
MSTLSAAPLRQKFVMRYAERNVPRYTSYPTAADFHNRITPEDHQNRLRNIAPKSRVSVYLHVPFCRQLCHYCGCHTRVVQRQDVIDAYGATLLKEIYTVGRYIPHNLTIGHLSWGGGTPSILGLNGMAEIVKALQNHFNFADYISHAVELDPRYLDTTFCQGLFDLGVNRASLGVQDFNLHIQEAIGRIQPFQQVEQATKDLRVAGIRQVNFDLLYGLPGQNLEEIRFNCEKIAQLSPDRIACFGYAHLPERKANQKLINSAALPDAQARFEQAQLISTLLQDQGYYPIGIDHFAKKQDLLRVAADNQTLSRNFQGYTTDNEPVLIGIGASAISTFSDAYIQNIADISTYSEAIKDKGLASTRGITISLEDQCRSKIISALMCNFSVDLSEMASDLNLESEWHDLVQLQEEGLVSLDGQKIVLTQEGRPFVRIVAAVFDTYRRKKNTGFSRAI